jgi:lactoylglutathione lyase
MPLFAYTILYVRDVAYSVSFYEAAFGLERKFIAPENSYAELSTGATTLAFASLDLAKSNLSNGFTPPALNEKPFAIEIGFTTDDVDATIEKAVKAGAIVEEKPKVKPWGQSVAYIRDPDGFLVEICTPM